MATKLLTKKSLWLLLASLKTSERLGGAASGHVLVFSAAGLERIVHAYVAYYMHSRTHLSLDKDSPTSRPVTPTTIGRIVARPEVNGLHHRYDRAA